MKRIIRIGSIGLVIAGAIAGGNSANAEVPALSTTQNPNGSSIDVTIFGTPRTQVPLSISGSGTQVSKSFRANGCGHVIIPKAASYAGLTVNGVLINTAKVFTATAIAPPTCQGTESSILPLPTHDYDGGNGITFSQSWNIGGGSILFKVPVVANAPNGRMVDAAYADNSAKSRFVSLNACGLAKVTKVARTAIITVNNGTAVDLSTFTGGLSAPLKCAGDKVVGEVNDFSAIFTQSLPTVYKDPQNSIYFVGSAGATVSVGLAAQPATKSITSDRCGGLTRGSRLTPQTAPFTIGSQTIDPSTLPVGLKPNCKSTAGVYAYDVTPTNDILKTSDGVVFVKATTANPTGFGDRRIVQITTSGSATRSLKANSCGIASIKSTTSKPILGTVTFEFGGTNYTVSDLPVHAASCVNAGTSAAPDYKLYRALN